VRACQRYDSPGWLANERGRESSVRLVTQAMRGDLRRNAAEYAKSRHFSFKQRRSAALEQAPWKAAGRSCDFGHIVRFEPTLSSQHQNVMHATLHGV
jgi:hypothetical protein